MIKVGVLLLTIWPEHETVCNLSQNYVAFYVNKNPLPPALLRLRTAGLAWRRLDM